MLLQGAWWAPCVGAVISAARDVLQDFELPHDDLRRRDLVRPLLFSRPYLNNSRAYVTVVICRRRPSVCLSRAYCG